MYADIMQHVTQELSVTSQLAPRGLNNSFGSMFPLPRKEHRKVVFEPRTKLVEVLDSAQEYLDLAIKSKDRGEREFLSA